MEHKIAKVKLIWLGVEPTRFKVDQYAPMGEKIDVKPLEEFDCDAKLATEYVRSSSRVEYAVSLTKEEKDEIAKKNKDILAQRKAKDVVPEDQEEVSEKSEEEEQQDQTETEDDEDEGVEIEGDDEDQEEESKKKPNKKK